MAEKDAAQAELLSNRLAKRYRHLKKWAKRIGTDAFRLYDRDIPEIPLLLDLYGDTVSGALYERPYEKDPAAEDRWLLLMRDATARVLGLPPEQIFIKQRRHQRGTAQYDRLAAQGVYRDVREGGLLFRVNVSDYLDTGLFLDHRLTRGLVRAESSGKRVLNLFSYTGSFSVYAASGGAAEVDSVDLSNTYLDWAALNFKLNGFEPHKSAPEAFSGGAAPAGAYRLVRADAVRFLSEAQRTKRRWDLIILDPPTFSNSKKMAGNLDVRRDFFDLVRSCVALLAPGGRLWFSTNARGFRLDAADFPGLRIRDQKKETTDEDFHEKSRRSCYTFTL